MPLFGNSNFLQALGWAVLNSLWQMAFLWVIFQVILSFGIHKPSVKTRMATVFVCTGFSWFLFTLIHHWIINPAAAKNSFIALDSFSQTDIGDWNATLTSALPWASAVYLVFLILPTVQFFRNYRYVKIIRTTGLSKANIDLRIFVQKFADYIGIRKPVHVYVSELISSPVTIGFFKPIILLPLAAISHLSVKQVEAILLHELAHIRRYDYFFNLLINFIKTVLYYNPFVKLFVRTIEREREKSCDELVIQFQYDPLGYASALLALEKNYSPTQIMAIAARGQKNDLLHRVERILGLEKRKVYDLRKVGGLLAGFICIFALNFLFILGKPVINNHSFTFDRITNPFLFMSDGAQAGTASNVETKKPETNNLPKPAAETARINLERDKNSAGKQGQHRTQPPPPPLQLMKVAWRENIIPELMQEEEAQVQGTVAATKKILKEGQWKTVEKNVADALTMAEKENLKTRYYTELDKVDWKKLENRLRISYNNINWDNVNAQMGNALSKITIDSLTTVFNVALTNLNTAETWMTANNINSIPDTNFKLLEVQMQKEKVQQQLKTLSAIKERKIIHI
jgi:beta-lactamase regulating signal transducer with metallopeptidase domain